MSTTGVAPASGSAPAQRGNPLLDAPILSTILRLTAPSLVLALFQTAVSIGRRHFPHRVR